MSYYAFHLFWENAEHGDLFPRTPVFPAIRISMRINTPGNRPQCPTYEQFCPSILYFLTSIFLFLFFGEHSFNKAVSLCDWFCGQTRVTQFKQEDEMKWRKHEDRGPRGGRPQHSFILDPTSPPPRLLKNEQSIYILDHGADTICRDQHFTLLRSQKWMTDSFSSPPQQMALYQSRLSWIHFPFFTGWIQFSLSPSGSYCVHSLLEAAYAGNELQYFSRVPRCFFFSPTLNQLIIFLQSHSEQLCQRFQISKVVSKQS